MDDQQLQMLAKLQALKQMSGGEQPGTFQPDPSGNGGMIEVNRGQTNMREPQAMPQGIPPMPVAQAQQRLMPTPAPSASPNPSPSPNLDEDKLRGFLNSKLFR